MKHMPLQFASLLSVVFVGAVIACGGDTGGPPETLTERLEITPPAGPLRVGAVFDLVARALDKNGQPTGSPITWASSDSSVIRGGSFPEIVGPGTITLTASAGGKSTSIQVSVIQAPVVAAGGRNTCMLNHDGVLYCWGSGEWNMLMRESNEPAYSPQRMPIDKRFTQLALGGVSACAATSLGEVYCWGNQYGLTMTLLTPRMQKIFGKGGFTTFCGIALDDAAYCWGNGTNAELGNGAKTSWSTPVRVNTTNEFVSIAIGGTVCGRTAGGSVYCWGMEWRGQPVNECGWPACVLTPTLLTTMTVRANAVINLNFPVALVGTDLSAFTDQPINLASAVRFETMTSGDNHICGLDAGGTAYCWGTNDTGELGNGSFETQSPATQDVAVVGGLQFRSIATGREHTCGVTTSDDLYCWGTNHFGELGRGVSTNREHTPAKVVFPEAQ